MSHSCLVAALRPEFLRSLKRTLEPELEVVGMADNPLSLQDSLRALEPDVVVVDLAVLGDAPWRLITSLRRHSPVVRLIALADGDDPDVLERVLEAGADDVVERSRIVTSLISTARKGRSSSGESPRSPTFRNTPRGDSE